jgi:hypothetical protein
MGFDRVFHLFLSDVPVTALQDVAVIYKTVFDVARRPRLARISFSVGVDAFLGFSRCRDNSGCEEEREECENFLEAQHGCDFCWKMRLPIRL